MKEYPIPVLHTLPLRERPAYRVGNGAGACNVVELLAAVVGGPRQIEIAQDLLARFEGLPGLMHAPVAELAQAVPGLGPAGATRLKAALELGTRRLHSTLEERLTVRSPADVAQLLIPEMSHLEQEHLRVLYLDTRNRVLGQDTVYVGTLNQAHVRVAEVFRDAVRRNCAAIIVAHNHPSSDCAASPSDVELTRMLIKAGKLLDVELMDHVIIGGSRYVSLRERGLGFSDC